MAGLPAGVTAGPLAIAPPALSFHLKALTHAGLLVQQHAANFFALAEAKARADRWPVQYSILNASILGRVGSAQADERMKTSATGYTVPKPKTPWRDGTPPPPLAARQAGAGAGAWRGAEEHSGRGGARSALRG